MQNLINSSHAIMIIVMRYPEFDSQPCVLINITIMLVACYSLRNMESQSSTNLLSQAFGMSNTPHFLNRKRTSKSLLTDHALNLCAVRLASILSISMVRAVSISLNGPWAFDFEGLEWCNCRMHCLADTGRRV